LAPIGCSQQSDPEFYPILANSYILAPAARTLVPVAIEAIHGQVTSAGAVLTGGTTILQGQGSYVVFDFGKEVGGIASLQFGKASDSSQSLAMAFSESLLYAGMTSDDSSGGNAPDGSLPISVTPNGSYVVPTQSLRGGFRYLTVGLTTAGSVELTGVSLQFTAAPTMADLRDYAGGFYSNDDLLNRIWYAGAYTVQMDTIDPLQGRVWPPPASGWLNNGVSGFGSSIVVDGAKRDRMVWPGDMGIATVTAYVSRGDTSSVKTSLEVLFAHQASSGCLPFSGPEANSGPVSDTYHLWTLVAVVEYYLYSGDRAWLLQYWPQIQQAVQFSTAKIGADGLFSVTLTDDWGRQPTGGEEVGANSLLYRVLRGASFLASVVGDSASATLYDTQATSLRTTIQSLLWDSAAGLYTDTPGSSLYPQDGNSLALWFGIPQTAAQRLTVSQSLRSRWNAFGAVTPERPNGIATFPGSMEVMAHFAADDDQAGLDLIRLEWGYMLSSPIGTGSTFWEGYLRNGYFDYGGPYMSLAHGWATGPTGALSLYVAGIGPELSASTQFHFIPHVGDLSQAYAALPLPMGSVSVTWTQSAKEFSAQVSVPDSMVGRYGIPVGSGAASVSIDGQTVWSSCAGVVATQYGEVSLEGGRVYLSHVAGSHNVIARETCSG
jgi:hypothetical protein